MQRSWNGRPLELLAPAGTFDIYREIIASKCDAVYLGGQKLNMRMIRKGYNLSDDELRQAVSMADDLGKNVYVTLNSLVAPNQIDEAREYLTTLGEIKPHALIVQDMAILRIMRELGIDIPVHASVMMNVHNLDMVRTLEGLGVTKVVVSREMPLAELRNIHMNSDVELEYFTQGDMCVTHGAQCLYSSHIFGMSSNRGQCLKPCRWPFAVVDGGKTRQDAPAFPLAVKDINMYSHLSDMILSGVSSFKIEGRMRQKEYIVELVNHYGDALDAFLADPLSQRRPDNQVLEPYKKRDISTGYAFGKPGRSNINSRGEGSGKFYSTGKMFSTPEEEPEVPVSVGDSTVISNGDGPGANPASISAADTGNRSASSSKSAPVFETSPAHRLSVRVNTPVAARAAAQAGANRIYLTTEPFAPATPASLVEIAALHSDLAAVGCELFASLPRMMSDTQIELFDTWLAAGPKLDGILVSHFGSLPKLTGRGYTLVTDSSMNVYNSQAAAQYREMGADESTASLELPLDDMLQLASISTISGISIEAVIHGRPAMMYMDHDVSERQADIISLKTEVSELPIIRDFWDRYHLLSQKDYTLLPQVPRLMEAGYRNFRLELQAWPEDQISAITSQVSDYLQNLGELAGATNQAAKQEAADAILSKIQPLGSGFTYGAQHV